MKLDIIGLFVKFIFISFIIFDNVFDTTHCSASTVLNMGGNDDTLEARKFG